jgi:hypothetical protein
MIPAMTCRALLTTASVMFFLASQPTAQVRPQESQKPALTRALRDLRARFEVLRRQQLAFGSIVSSVDMAERPLGWLENQVPIWNPRTADEGSAMRTALERMTRALEKLPSDRAAAEALVKEVAEDLQEKGEYCRVNGLAARRQVRVITKRDGVTEVKGLEVYYLEKFLASDVNAQPMQFRGFSSPAVDDLPPGRYVFWARESGAAGRTGPRKEARVGMPPSDDTIEVLVP